MFILMEVCASYSHGPNKMSAGLFHVIAGKVFGEIKIVIGMYDMTAVINGMASLDLNSTDRSGRPQCHF